ncbi:hypothetical protein BGZ93_002556 [Podila epicladia]|nr:hypothetical protein BGZ92_004108 [Podila epicladia]KAG0100318.1 hypothetical protein BGZ93_002556 [Podila epicladia]
MDNDAPNDFQPATLTSEMHNTLATPQKTVSMQNSGQVAPSRSKLLLDSDDDMDDLDDDDDDELLTMPVGKIELQLDQGISVSQGRNLWNLESSLPKIDTSPIVTSPEQPSTFQTPTLQLPRKQSGDNQQTNLEPTKPSRRLIVEEEDDDDLALFGDDFMAQFGQEAEEEYERSQSKKPLFNKRVPLLESTADHGVEGEDDLGLDRLSISQKHRTISGAPAAVTSTKSTHTATSSTTIVSALPSRFSLFNRQSVGRHSSMVTDESSQLEEELLEMSARQHDAMLEDLIEQDQQMMDEDEGLQAILDKQYEEQEEVMQLHQQYETAESGKRKSPPAPWASTTTSLEDIDRLLDESFALEGSHTASAQDASKKSRTGNSAGANLSARSGVVGGSQPRRTRIVEEPKRDYSIPPATGPYITAKDSKGRILYFAKRARADLAKESMAHLMNLHEKKSLLATPIHRMMDELDAEIRVKKQEAINRLEYGGDDDIELDEEVDKDSSERLWVDKYRPKKYTDLMGDERVNREVLSWIKEWDQCVFGRKFKKYTPEHKKQQFKEFGRKPDPLGRPDRKVLLLTGPPGLGKTTMAHVIAKQAGYNVVEVNASDDRTGASVKGKIEAALEIQSILGSDKPNMLIIDEIDGVSSSGGEQSFIKLLVDMATVEAGATDEKAKSGTSGGSRRSKKYIKKPLMRPIICICNDQYAPVLRPLRVIAQIYQFRKPSVRTVVTRLQQICEIEQVPSDTRAFGVLYEMTEGDMRSCLNTLQFIKNKSKIGAQSTTTTTSLMAGNGGGLTVDTLNRATIGRKDQNKSLFSVWEELFQAPYARKSRSALKVLEEGRDGLVKDENNTYVSRMVTLVHTNGDYDKLMQGCFENYTAMTFHDTAMSKVVENGEWLSFYDQLNTKVTANFEYEVGGYIAYALVNFHRFFAGSVRQKIEYPRKDYESFVAHKANESILQGMMLNLPVKVQRYFRKTNFATELLSPLLRILSPFLRPVNKQLIKPEEREVLQRLVDVMIHFQLTFVQEKTEDGQFVYRLEPSIEKLGDFSSIGLKNVLTNRYAVRQLIAQEIELEIVRRTEAAKEVKLAASLGASSLDSTMMASLSMAVNTSLDMDKDKLEREAVDFFGRTIVVNDKSKVKDAGSVAAALPKKKQTRIWYKFNEGFSNAVKAKVLISELL